jgi:hypothetical protein
MATHFKETRQMLLNDFADRAEECLRLAQRMTSPHDRDLLVEIARAWYGIAHDNAEVAGLVKRPN